ncbi:MAG: ArsR family transcriptional regulator [Candidatus Omnitrophota bacterium]|nr:ArsR family transcriptional regulator [Candidatus Omnitrophota bacterium]
MAIENSLDSVLNTKTKVKIIRLFISRTNEFHTSGREIAKSIKVSPPAAHAALKKLYNQGILKLEIIGKQHIYSLNDKNRLVRDILKPSFKKEISLKDDIKRFIAKKIKKEKLARDIISIILYGSLQCHQTTDTSDVDIAVITKDKIKAKKVEDAFIENIAVQFHEYFGFHLDVYVKSKEEFLSRIKRRLSPVSSLAKSYSVIYGKDLIELKTIQ